jgi:hypothetical protein
MREWSHVRVEQLAAFILLGFFVWGHVSAAITYSAVYSAKGNSAAATVKPTTSTGAAAGNIYVAQILVVDGDCAAIVTPAGWTRRACDSHASQIKAIYTRPAQPSDVGVTFSFPLGATRQWASTLLSYAGVDLVNPLDAGPSVNTYTNSKSATATSITTQTPGAMAVLLTSATTSATKFFTPPSGWSERSERGCNNSLCRITASDRVYSAPQATGAVTTTLKSASSGIVHLLALRPFSRVAYWPLDGVNWLEDASGNGHTLSANGGATPVSAKVCTGFNGTGGTYLTANDSALLDLPDRYTLAAWVYPTAYPASDLKTILSKDENYELHITPAGKLYWWWTESGGTVRSITSQGNIPLNQWTHIAVVFDRTATSQRQRIYINGVQESTTYLYGTAAQTNTDQLYIGSDVGYTSGAASRNFLGMIDEVYVYSGALGSSEINTLMGVSHPCAVDHYRLKITDGTALTCEAEPVTIEACANTDCTTAYSGSGSITLSANNGATINGAASPQSIALNNGSASASIQKTTAGATTLGLSGGNPSPTSSTPYRCFIGGGEVSWSACQISFQEAKLTIDIPDFVACTGTSNATIMAEGCGSTVSGSKSLKMWMNYLDPNTANGEVLKVGSTTVPTAKPSSTNLTLTFDANGEATLPLVNYDDAGEIRFFAELTDNGVTLAGQTDVVSAPEKLKLSASGGACSSPYEACTKFTPAGVGFPLTLQALCSSGKVTKNFRLSSIPLQHARVAPDPGADGRLAPTEVSLVAADNGQKNFDASISEVGVFSILPAPVVYKGVSVAVEGTGALGRFYPHHFDTEVTEGCTGFTYSGQPFGLKVLARNNSGETTLNYAGSFAKSMTLTNVTGTSGQFTRDLLACSSCVNASDFSAGEAILLTPKRIAFEFANKTTAPAILKVRANDTDTGAASGLAEGETVLRAGRMTVARAHSYLETQPVSIPVVTEFYDGTTFKRNDLDQCTNLTSSAIRLDSDQETNQTDGNIAVGVGGSTNMSVPNGGAFSSGTLTLGFSAPGAPNNGFTDITPQLGSMPWLRYDWDGDGVHDDDPKGRASWGMYRGNRNVIYLRERWN